MRQRVHYFDYLRVFAAISVVFMHVAAGPLRSAVDGGWHVLNGLTALAFTAVPLFFMMSGYLLLTDEKTADTAVLLKKRLPKLLVPLAVWSVIAVVWNGLKDGNLGAKSLLDGLISALHTPQAVHFWYMYTLIALYVLSPILYGGLKNLDKTGHALVLGLCLAVSVRAVLTAVLPASVSRLLQIDLLDKVQLYGGHLCSFVLGYYLGTWKKKLSPWLLGAAAAALWAAVALGTWWKTASTGAFNQTFQSQSAGFEVLLAACLFLLAKQTVNTPARLLQKVPVVPLSMGIYMMHNILLSVLHRLGIVEQGLWGTLAMTAAVFAMSYLGIKTAMTVPVACYALTGTPWRAACKTCNWIFTFRKKQEVTL